MPKRLLEDMIKVRPVKKQITPVVPKGPVEMKPEVKQEIWQEPTVKEMPEIKELVPAGAKRPRSRYLLWLIALISVAFCFFAVSFLFSKVEITVNPKTEDVKLNDNLSATRDSNDNGIFFNLMGPISGEENKTIQAIGEKDVQVSATGTAVIYNSFGSSPQTLDIDTRLEGSNGKMYKTKKKIIVPGKSANGVLGSVEVDIYAAAAGANYNSGPLDFKIFGFKGTPKYSKFYGRSKGEITGGFVGKTPAITDADQTTAVADLKTGLEAKLLLKATSQIPSGFILFKDAIFPGTDDSNLSSVYNSDNTATLTLKGTLYGILFNEEKLTKKIAKNKIEKYNDSDIYMPNIRSLVFSLTSKDSVSYGDVKNINFNLSGPAKFVWKLDMDKFIGSLLSKSKKDFNQILSQYPNIESATLALSPFWRISIPDKSKNIKVIVNYPQ